MIIDTSALVAVVFQEPGYRELLRKMARSSSTGIGTPTLAETGVVLSARLDRDVRGLVTRLLDDLGISEVPFGKEHWREATDAFRHFGRGTPRSQVELW